MPSSPSAFPAASFATTYASPPLRWTSLPNLSASGWSGTASWSDELSAGRIPMHNNVVYSPVMLYDYASMKGDFKTIGSDVFERGGVFYSLVDINGSKALQPIGAGGDQGFFGAYKGLSDAERTTLATHLLGRVQSGDEKSADAVRFLLPRMNEAEVEKNPESWRALSALVAADAALKPPGSKEALEKLDKYLAAAPPPAAPPSVDAGGHKKED